MAIRSVVDIDINDGRFKEFSAQFQKYQELLAKTPGAWANMDKSMQSGFSTLSSALLAQLDIINKTNKAEQDLNNTSNKAASAWRDISKSTKSVLTNIKDTTISLFKWASVGTIFTGLLGAGSLFGLTELAGGVGATRRQSLGIGTTYGEKKAFDVNYGRIVDSDAYLSNVNASLHDVTKRNALYSAGLSDSDLRGKDTAQVALALIPKLKELADKTNPALLGQVLEARRLDQFISLQDFERLRNTSKAELGGYASAFGRDVGAFGQDEKTQRAWQDFSVQLSRAGQKIEGVFVRGLEPLTPALSHLSDSIANALKGLLSNPKMGDWIKSFGDGIEGAAKYIGGDQFPKDVKSFVDGVSDLAKGVVEALKWLGVIPDKEQQDRRKAENKAGTDYTNDFHKYGSPTENSVMNPGKPWGSRETTLDNLEKKYKLPKGILLNTYGAESGYGAHLKSSVGAQGPMQIMPQTAKGLGLKDPYDFDTSSDAAARLYVENLKVFHGDVAKAAAAYNWNPKSVANDVKMHGAAWRDFLPAETKHYLKEVLDGTGLSKGIALKLPADYRPNPERSATSAHSASQAQPKQPKSANVKIDMTINNPAGANIVVTASQLPQ